MVTASLLLSNLMQVLLLAHCNLTHSRKGIWGKKVPSGDKFTQHNALHRVCIQQPENMKYAWGPSGQHAHVKLKFCIAKPAPLFTGLCALIFPRMDLKTLFSLKVTNYQNIDKPHKELQQSVVHKRTVFLLQLLCTLPDGSWKQPCSFHGKNPGLRHHQSRLLVTKSVTWSLCLNFFLYPLRRWRGWSLRNVLVLKFYNSTSVENITGVPEASLPFHAENENLPKKTSSSWKRKGSRHLFSLAAQISLPQLDAVCHLHSQLQAAACGHESQTRRARNRKETREGSVPSILAS